MGQSREQVLGRDVRGPIGAEGLDAVPWSHGDTDAMVEFTTNELTALCPITGQPDFYELTLNYRPGGSLIESKSLKLYLWSFRDRGIFAGRDDSGPDPAGARRTPDPDRGPPPSQNTRQLATSTCSSWRLPRMRVLPRFGEPPCLPQ